MNNGLIEIKASPDFGPGIYSLKTGQCQWLDNSFLSQELEPGGIIGQVGFP